MCSSSLFHRHMCRSEPISAWVERGKVFQPRVYAGQRGCSTVPPLRGRGWVEHLSHPWGRVPLSLVPQGRTYASMPQRCSVVIVRGAAPTGTMKVPTTTASVSGSSFLTSIDASGPISKNVSPTP
jgi:hypothetical protein